MDNISETKNKVMSLVLSNYDCLKFIVEKSILPSIITEKSDDESIIKEYISWHKKYQKKPSKDSIINEINKNNHNLAVSFKDRLLELAKVEGKENEFPHYIEILKHHWAVKEVEKNIHTILTPDKKSTNLLEYDNSIKELISKLYGIHNNVMKSEFGGESFTTANAAENIDLIKNRDNSSLRRFHLGHNQLDEATGGFFPGELLMIVGNVNQGKSMVLANAAYNMWLHDHANILILTAEMQPEMFDDRIYSRASSVDYGHILSGKTQLLPEEIDALDVTVKEMGEKQNQIIVKWLNNSDSAVTVAKILDDYEKMRNFIPDILIIDSLECLTPSTGNTGKDWEDKGRIVEEFKSFAETFHNGRKIFVISTHQAKTITSDKEFKDIDITDIGRSKIVAEKADAAIYLRCRDDLKRMQIKTIKARRFSKDLSWNMAYNFAKVSISNIENDSIINE